MVLHNPSCFNRKRLHQKIDWLGTTAFWAVKINSDGALDNSGNAASGGLIRDHCGNLLVGFQRKIGWQQNYGVWEMVSCWQRILAIILSILLLILSLLLTSIETERVHRYPSFEHSNFWLHVSNGKLHNGVDQPWLPGSQQMCRSTLWPRQLWIIHLAPVLLLLFLFFCHFNFMKAL